MGVFRIYSYVKWCVCVTIWQYEELLRASRPNTARLYDPLIKSLKVASDRFADEKKRLGEQ
jgi:hypothetical protein